MQPRSFIHRLIALMMLMSLVAYGAGTPTSRAQTTNASASNKLLVIHDSAADQSVKQSLANKLVDYGSFSLWTVSDSQLNQLKNLDGAQFDPTFDTIFLRDLNLDTRQAVPAVPDRYNQTLNSGEQLWLVQFVGPLKDEWLNNLVKQGLDPVIYMPNNGYIVWGSGESIQTIQAESNKGANGLQWTGAYHQYYRIAPAVRQALESSDQKQLIDVTFQVYNSPDSERLIREITESSVTVYKSPSEVLKFRNVSVQMTVADVNRFAQRAELYNLGAWVAPQKMDERQNQIIAGNVTITGTNRLVPSSPGYLAWLASKGFPTDQNQYPIVDVVDDGIDNGTTNPIHPDFYVNGTKPGTSRIHHNANCTNDPLGDGLEGHGNINAGIVGSYNNLTGSPHVDAASDGIPGGYRIGLGVSPYGRVAGTKIFNNAGSYNISACGNTDQGVVKKSYDSGATFTSNSWGANVGGAYDDSSQAYDALTRDASSVVAGNQQMLHVFSAGNRGSTANTIGSPGTAKNVLTVSATENVRANGWTDGCGEPNADNANDMAGFSSRGPTDDGRVKPDISAPGTHIVGPASQIPGYNGNSVCNQYYPTGQTLYALSSGTSHSAPAVAGATSLYYTWYRLHYGGGTVTPSPAMLKAYQLNSTRYLNGIGTGGNLPSNSQGYGNVDMNLGFDGAFKIFMDQQVTFGNTGDQWSKTVQVLSTAQPFRVTVAWTDAPGTTTGNSYVNNLDLEITDGVNVYKGNVFNGANSVTGGTADGKNNVESVMLPAGTSGSFTIIVRASNLAGDGVPGNADTTDQDFAVAIYNGSEGPTGGLTGTVKHTTGTPIPGATVQAGSVMALTDIAGVYQMRVPVGTYTVTASLEGYSSQSVPNVVITQNVTTTQNFILQGGAIQGTVYDAFTPPAPVAGATVTLDGTTTTTTDAVGHYSFATATVGAHSITVSKSPQYAPVTQSVTVADDQTTTQNFTLPAGAVTGVVSDSGNGAPLSGASVTVGSQTTTTNSAGVYAVRTPPGTYSISASKPGYSAPTITGFVISNGITSTQNIALTPTLGIQPDELSRSFVFGSSSITYTNEITVTNNSSSSFTWELREIAGSFTPFKVNAGKILVVNNSATATTAATQALTTLGYAYDVQTRTVFETQPVATLLTYDAIIFVGTTGTSATNPSNTKLTEYLDAGGRLLIMDNDLGYWNKTAAFYTTYLDSTYVGDTVPTGSRTLTGVDIMSGVTAPNADTTPDYYTPGSSSTTIFRYADNTIGGSRITRNTYKAIYIATDLDRLGTTATNEPIEATVVDKSLRWLIGGFDAIPWLAEDPTSGTLAGGVSTNVAVGWYPNKVAQPGTYTGKLEFSQSSSPTITVQIPVTMIVTPSALQAQVSGTVSTSGLCDVNVAPLANAKVQITGTGGFSQTLTTDANGYYSYFLPSGGTYTFTVSAPGQQTYTETVTIADGATITKNFTLRLLAACIGVNPTSLEVSMVMGQAPVNRTVTVSSTGALPLNVVVHETEEAVKPAVSDGSAAMVVPYAWVDASSGTATNIADEGELNYTLPFSMPFYGNLVGSIRIGNNGGILLNNSTGDISYSNTVLTATTAPNWFLAPFWDDIDSDTGTVYVLATGTAPNRSVVIEWNNRPHYSNIGSTTFQAILYEDGRVVYQYKDVDFGNPLYDNGVSATVGVRGANATRVVQYSFNEAVISDNMALCFSTGLNDSCGDVAWFEATPKQIVNLAGTPPSTATINVQFDATSFTQPGVYTANLVLTHNSPQQPVIIPITLTITPPANYGTINGTVNGLEACDANSAPLAGATVVVNGTTPMTLTTDANGQYSIALPAGTYTLTISKPGYVTQTITVVVSASGTVTPVTTLRLNAPCLGYDPDSLSSTQPTNTIVTQTLVLSNSGALSMTWSILEEPPARDAVPSNGDVNRKPVANPLTGDQLNQSKPAANVIQDGSFEATNPTDGTNPNWSQTSTNFGVVLCSTALCGSNDGAAPHTGTFYAWFGGTSAAEAGSLSQAVMIPSGTATLNFWLRVGAKSGSANDYLKVTIDGTEVFRVDATTTSYTTYTLISVPIDQYANGASHTVEFYSSKDDGATTNFFVDDVELDSQPVTCTADALPWVKAVPNSGTIDPNGTANVAIVFDSTGLAIGTYTGNLCLNTSDPNHATTKIPVTLVVVEDPIKMIYMPLIFNNAR